jgi:hypothetical protein
MEDRRSLRQTEETPENSRKPGHLHARARLVWIDPPTVAAWLGDERPDTVRSSSQPDAAALERAAAAFAPG